MSRSRILGSAVALMLLAVLPVLTMPTTSSAAGGRPADGLTQATAAGSCWEVKQTTPAAPDGVYWLITPALAAPQQFYCDQTTNGGGWVLVGRGRQGWKPYYNGLGSAAAIRNTPGGTGAFSPAQLPSQTVDGLLNNTAVRDLADGVRLRRAADTTGTTWQESRFKLTIRGRWAWTFAAANPVGAYSLGASTGSGGTTANFGRDNAFSRVDTRTGSAQAFLWGFAYGPQVLGNTAAGSYIWSASDGLGNGRPFTQMYLRPQLRRDAMFTTAVPDSGTAKQERRAMPESDAMRTVWGVNGLADGVDTELRTEVSAFGQVGNTVFVGGNFANVRRDSAGTGQVDQRFLAGFDVGSGELVTGFRPTFDKQVRAITALPDGRLAVGGEFTTVNGTPQAGLAFLDPATGALSGAQVTVENRTSGGVPSVRGFAVRDGYLYVSGAFTHLVQGAVAGSGWNGGRINLSNTRPDTGWNPAINGTTVGIEASGRGDRVYYAGYFNTVQGQTADRVSAVAPAPGAALVLPGFAPRFSTPVVANQWQFAVREVGDRFYYGGSQHNIFGYDRNTLEYKSGSITLSGGDIQTIWSDNPYGTTFAGCHCGDFNYEGTSVWPQITGFREADSINLFGGWDSATGAYLPDFNPITVGRKGYGVWAIFTDSRGNLWAGGDLRSSIRAGYTNQWSGGFARFAPRDSQAPTTPTNLSQTSIDATSFRLSWGGSTDNAGAASYEVIEGNRVIATTSATNAVIERLSETQRYFVRAVDSSGNRSASTSVLSVAGAGSIPAPPAAPVVTATPQSSTVIRLTWPAQEAANGFVVNRDGTAVGTLPAGATQYDDTGLTASTQYTYTVVARDAYGQSTSSAPVQATTQAAPVEPQPETSTLVATTADWRWRFQSAAPDATWREPTYDDSTWALGAAPLGLGTTLAATNIANGAPSPRPLSAQFRTSFTVADVSKLAANLDLTFVADDGVVVYVNGVEVRRQNLPAGTLTNNSYATAAPSSTTANNNPVVMTIPRSALVNGSNTVSAQMHANYRSTPNMHFKLSLVSKP